MRFWITSGILLIGVVGSALAQAVTSDVFRAQVMIQGSIQSGPTPSNQTIQAVKLNGEDLVNLALGRPLGTKLQANEILAYVSTFTTNTSRLVVFDPSVSSNLAIIGQITPQLAVIGENHHRNMSEVGSDMTVPGAGNATNGLTGGSFILDARSLLETNDAIRKLHATGIGFLDAMTAGTNLNVLVRTATIATQGKKLGALIEP